MFKRIVAAAALAGVMSGALLTVIQQIEIVPLIEAAEVREAANLASQPAHQHPEVNQPWTPHDGWQRALATAVSNIILAIAFALLLGSAMSLRQSSGWRVGLVWGIAGYVVFFVAPALGLPPELPGTDAAPLSDRQLWWVGTAGCTAVGLWLVASAGKPLVRVFGLVLLCAPHVLGAPQAPIDDGANSGDLAKEFVRATYLANAAMWLSLGALVGIFGGLMKSAEDPDEVVPAESTK
jgi:cobalt transporter subunit CbtA